MTQTVFITGCSSGVGKSAARHFARQGWNVVATMVSKIRINWYGIMNLGCEV